MEKVDQDWDKRLLDRPFQGSRFMNRHMERVDLKINQLEARKSPRLRVGLPYILGLSLLLIVGILLFSNGNVILNFIANEMASSSVVNEQKVESNGFSWFTWALLGSFILGFLGLVIYLNTLKGLQKWMTIIRRAIIIIFALILIPDGASYLFESKQASISISEDIQQLIDFNKAEEYSFDKTMELDDDIVRVQKIVIAPESIIVYYSYERAESGWSFPSSAFKLRDDQGREYNYRGGGNNGEPWGSSGDMRFEKPAENIQALTLTFDLYDRHETLVFPLNKGGVQDE